MNSLDGNAHMKPGLLAALVANYLLIFHTAAASETNVSNALSFTQRDGRALQALISNRENCAALVQSAVAANIERARAGSAAASVKIIDACHIASLNHDGKLQVRSLVDFTGGDGPLSYIAIFKHSGFVYKAEIPVGEGNKDMGPVSLSLEDIRHDGRLEIIDRERSVDVNGHMSAYTAPAPSVTHIYVWRNDNFAAADTEFRDFFTSTVLPTLRYQLAAVESLTPASPTRQAEASALQNSIALADRLLAKGHY